MIVAREALLDRSWLITPGAPVYWYSRIRLKEGIVAERWITNFERAEPHAGYRIVNAENGVPGAERTLALVTTLLNFLPPGSYLAVQALHSVTVWLERKLPTSRFLKRRRHDLTHNAYLSNPNYGAAAIGVATGLILGSTFIQTVLNFRVGCR